MANNEIRNPAKAYFKWRMPVIAKSEDDWSFWNTEDKYNRTMFIGYNDTTTPHVASLFMIVDGKAIQAVGDDVLARIAKMEVDISTQMAEIQQLITQANEQQQSINTLRTEVQLVLQNCSAFADEAEIWAEGSDEDVAAYGGEHSAKGWALRAGEIISTGLPSEASFDKLSVTGTIPSNDMSTRVPNTEWVQNAIQAGGGGVSPDSDITCRSVTATSGGASLTAAYSAARSETTSIKVIPATQGTAGSVVLDARTSNWEYPAQISMTNTLMQAKVPGRMEITVGDTDSSSVDLSISTQPYVSTPWTHQLNCMLPIRANNGLYVKNRSTNESAFIATNTLDDDAETNPKLTVSGTLSVYGERTNMNGSKSSVTMLAHRAASDTDGSYVMLKAENSGSGLQSYLDVQEGETQIGTPKLIYFDKGDKTSSTEAIRLGKASEQAYSTKRYIYSELIGRFVNGLQIGLINDYEPDGIPFKVLRSNTSTSGNWLAAFGVTPTVPDIADASDSSDKVPNTKWVQAAIAAGGGGGGTGGAVSSVNGKTGEVVLSGEDIRLHPTVGDYTYPAVSDVIDSISNYMPDGVSGDNKLVDNSSLSTQLATYQPKLTAGDGITISAENVISATGGSGGGAVTSVNGNTGAVVLTGDNIMTASDSTTSLNSALAGKQDILTESSDLTVGSLTAGSADSGLYAGRYSIRFTSNGNDKLFVDATGPYVSNLTGGDLGPATGAFNWYINTTTDYNKFNVFNRYHVTNEETHEVTTNDTSVLSIGGSPTDHSTWIDFTATYMSFKGNTNFGEAGMNHAMTFNGPSTFTKTATFHELIAGDGYEGTMFTCNANAWLNYDNRIGWGSGRLRCARTDDDFMFDFNHSASAGQRIRFNDTVTILSAMPDATDSSNIVPTTAWVNTAITNAVQSKANVSNTVTTDTVQTITETKNLNTGGTKSYSRPIQILMPTSTESNPTENKTREIAFISSEGTGNNYEGSLTHSRSTDGKSYTGFRAGTLVNGVYKGTAMGVEIHSDGRAYGTAPTPPDNSAGIEIVTAAWVNTKVGGFANTNADNFSVAGKKVLAGMGMPSSKYLDVPVGANGTTYTAPANGYFFAQGVFTQNDGYIKLYNNSKCSIGTTSKAGTDWGYAVFIPCQKGDQAAIFYNRIDNPKLTFLYAEGDQEGENNV